MSWPNGGDPFYLANTTDNNVRRYYYGVNATPTQKCDGVYDVSNPTDPANILSYISYRLTVPTPLWLQISTAAGFDSIRIQTTAVSDQNLSTIHRLHIVLADRYSYLSNSPNGQPHHYHAMRDMGPSAYGQIFSTTAFDTVRYSAVLPTNLSWLTDTLDVVCFVQNESTREIVQATMGTIEIQFPNLGLAGFLADDFGGNNDGRVDPGETGNLSVTLTNLPNFFQAQTATGVLTTSDPQITITVPQATYPSIAPGDSAANVSPFQFTVDPSLEPHPVTFTLTVNALPGNFTASYPVTFMVGRPNLLLVNDDPGGNYQSYYVHALDSLSRVHDVWNQHLVGAVPEDELMRYPTVIWYTGIDTATVLDVLEQQKLANFLDSGGNLLLSSQNAGDVLGGTAFYQEVIHAQHLSDHVLGFLLSGLPGDPVSDGTSICLVGASGANNANSSSNLTPLAPAEGIYFYQSDTTYGALRWDNGDSRLIYMAFAMESASGLVNTTSIKLLMQNCLEWLETPVAVDPVTNPTIVPRSLRIASVCPNPFNPSAAIAFDLPKGGWTQVGVFDLQGRLITRLCDEWMSPGQHQVRWNGEGFPSGLYLIELLSEGHSDHAKALLLK
jgi:hypothetical protein